MKESFNIPGKNHFKVPENYFEEVNRKILDSTVNSTELHEKKTIRLPLRKIILAAAAVTVVVILSYTGIRMLSPSQRETQVAEVIKELSPENLMNDIDISALEQDYSTADITDEISGVSKKDLVDYLLQENIDINEIYEQL